MVISCNFFSGEEGYDDKNRAINPTKKDMENLLRNMRKKNSKTDQHRLKDLVEDYKEEGNFAYFQPYQDLVSMIRYIFGIQFLICFVKHILGINQHINGGFKSTYPTASK